MAQTIINKSSKNIRNYHKATKKYYFTHTQTKTNSKEDKNPKFSCYYIFAQSTAVMSHQFVTRSHTMRRNTVPSFLSSRTADFQVEFNCLCKSNVNGTLSTRWPMFTSGERFINLSFCRYLHMSQGHLFQPIFLVFYISWEQR